MPSSRPGLGRFLLRRFGARLGLVRNVEFWEAKFRRNVERDRAAVAALTQMGWTPITIWECELKKDRIDATMEKVIEQVRAAEPQR